MIVLKKSVICFGYFKIKLLYHNYKFYWIYLIFNPFALNASVIMVIKLTMNKLQSFNKVQNFLKTS